MERFIENMPEIDPGFADSITLEPMTTFPGTDHSSWIRYTIIEKAKLQSLQEDAKKE